MWKDVHYLQYFHVFECSFSAFVDVTIETPFQMVDSYSLNQTPEQRVRDEINEYNPKIAVTVDMIATGTDVKPLECLLFMRDIKSSNIDFAPIDSHEGKGRMWQLFGDRMESIIEELNEV